MIKITDKMEDMCCRLRPKFFHSPTLFVPLSLPLPWALHVLLIMNTSRAFFSFVGPKSAGFFCGALALLELPPSPGIFAENKRLFVAQ